MKESNCKKNEKGDYVRDIPEPPKEIEKILDEYQDFLGSVFAREYKESQNTNTQSIYAPRLTSDEQHYIESLTRKLHACSSWKNYAKQCRQWAVMM